jgi:hypothetical protein
VNLDSFQAYLNRSIALTRLTGRVDGSPKQALSNF